MILAQDLIDKVQAAATDATRPPLQIECVEVTPYIDWAGEDSLEVLVIFPESLPDGNRTWDALKPIEHAIRAAVSEHGSELFPYIRYVKRSELVSDED